MDRLLIDVFPDEDGWLVLPRGRSDRRLYARKKEALEAAKQMAREAGLGHVFIRGKDGRVQLEWTCGPETRRRVL